MPQKTRQTKTKGADGEPYINHPLEVANLLANVGKIEDYDVLIAAVLHDTIEDTDTTEEEIAEMFGETVCGYVAEVTDDKSLPKARRKELQIEHAPHYVERREAHQTRRQNQQYPRRYGKSAARLVNERRLEYIVGASE